MRAPVLSLVLASLVAGQAAAADKDNPALRAYSRIVGLIARCGTVYPLDVPRARKYAAAFLDIARAAGARQSDVAAERDRREGDIDTTGVRPWCLASRASLRENGAKELFPQR